MERDKQLSDSWKLFDSISMRFNESISLKMEKVMLPFSSKACLQLHCSQIPNVHNCHHCHKYKCMEFAICNFWTIVSIAIYWTWPSRSLHSSFSSCTDNLIPFCMYAPQEGATSYRKTGKDRLNMKSACESPTIDSQNETLAPRENTTFRLWS